MRLSLVGFNAVALGALVVPALLIYEIGRAHV